MSKAYLRIEGVNLRHVLDDSNQLSVIRGGSLLLRQAVESDRNPLKQFSLKPISTGASVGLYEVETADPQGLRDDIAKALARDPVFRHFTFVVDWAPHRDGFGAIREELIARNRFRQLQQLSLALPGPNTKSAEPCGLDGLRPASGKVVKDKTVSKSVYCRFNVGRVGRQVFYRRELKNTVYSHIAANFQFTDDLQTLTKDARFGNLNGKMAVIYLDGNKFGKIQQDHCRDSTAQFRFDREVKALRREFLGEFLSSIQGDAGFHTAEKEIRLETLLWGGDEILFVVPAWKGLWTLLKFFEASANWKFESSLPPPTKGLVSSPLTHAGGLVFCHAKTPIYRVRELAKALAERAKEQMGTPRNAFHYLVLESIDFPTEPVDAFWRRVFGPQLAGSRYPLDPVEIDKVTALARLAEQKIPTGKVHGLVRALLADTAAGRSPEAEGARFQEERSRFDAVVGKSTREDLEQQLGRVFGQGDLTSHWGWIHLLDLWDYLDPQPDTGAAAP